MSAVGVKELHGMLRLRHALLAEQITADTERLSEVERRLRSIEKENTMSEHEYVLKTLSTARVAQRGAVVDRQAEVSAVISPMFERLGQELPRAGISLDGTAIATYDAAEGGRLAITAAYPVTVDRVALDGVDVVDLPAHNRVATVLHRGSISAIGDSWQALHIWIEQNGFEHSAPARELYLETPQNRRDDWVTELQQPIR